MKKSDCLYSNTEIENLDRKSDLKMAPVLYQLENAPPGVKVFYQLKPDSKALSS